MYLAFVYYPKIQHKKFQAFRNKYEPYANLLPEHLPLIFPVPESIGMGALENHILSVLENQKSIQVHFFGLKKTRDHWLFLTIKEGNDQILKLHDHFYQGMLAPWLRKELPYIPHLGLGLFSKERYDFNHSTTNLTLDKEKYDLARKEFEALNFDLWCTIDHLTMIRINKTFTKCTDIVHFRF